MPGRRCATVALACALVCATLFAALPSGVVPSPPIGAAAPAMTGLHVSGNQFKNGNGEVVRLRGVNRSGLEFACIQGWGLFDGPNDATSVAAIAAWGVNTVRIPVNSQCWLGTNGVKPEHGGANYQRALSDYIGLLSAQGMAAIIDLHWTAPGATKADKQVPMADLDHAPTFWAQVANAYKGNSAVLFDLFNEPYPDDNRDTEEAWRCWRDGGTCAGIGYQVAGMQTLVNAVRGTGATNVILLGGVAYAAHLSQWLTYRPTDPTGNLAAAWHIYSGSQCNTQDCWDAEAAPVATQVPLVAGEFGQSNCAHDFADTLMDWHDARGLSYLAWTWNTWDCSGPALITDYNGTPTGFGVGLKNRLASTGPSPSPPTGTTVIDDLNDFGKIAARSTNLAFDTTNTGVIGNDPSRLVRVAKSPEWAVWSLREMRQFTAITYVWPDEGFTPFSFAASPDGTNYTPLNVTPTDRGGNWQRYDYSLALPAGTNFVRVTFPNTSAQEWTPQISQVTYSSAGNSPAPTPAPSPSSNPSTTPAPSPSFTDVPAGYWAQDQIAKLAQRGITTGCGGAEFCPERPVTRAEMAAFIIRTVTSTTTAPLGPTNPTFSDVPPTHPQYGFIEALVKLGITTGCGGGEYCPAREVTRAEMAAFIVRALTNQTAAPPGPPNATFGDVPPGHPQYGFVEEMLRRGVTTGCGDPAASPRIYCPGSNVTRAEMAVFIIRAYP